MSNLDEHVQLRSSVRSFLAERSSSEAARDLMETASGFDRAVWELMAQQLGLQGLAIPEAHGGSGSSWVELGIVLEEMGSSLLCAPFLSTLLASQALQLSGEDRWLSEIANGSLIATVAWTPESGASTPLEPSVAAADGALTGSSMFVLDGDVADLILVVATEPAGLSLFAVEADATGLTRERLEALDLTRHIARISLEATPGTLVGRRGTAAGVLTQLADLATVAVACEQVGGAQRCLDMMVGYAKVREQFGRPIGSFQAIKHHCADVLLEVESARSAATWACTVAGDPAELALAAALVGSYCAEAYTHAAATNIQVHGGIGFTWEHDAHLHFRRAKSSELLLRCPDEHRDTLATLIGI
jgi:alkylation response protein AidB-like acyl-CoA dehydrogenase